MKTGLPYVDSLSEEEKLHRFFLKAKAWGWDKAFAALPSDALVVADPETIHALRSAYHSLRCRFKTRAQIKVKGLDGFTTIYCLLRSTEYRFVRQLRQRVRQPVLSMTYDVLPLGILADQQFPQVLKPVEGGALQNRNVFFSLAGADVDYVAHVLKQNDGMQVHETFGSAVTWWCSLANDISGLRLLRNYAVAHGGGILSVEMNMLYRLFAGRSGSLKRLVSWLESGSIKLVYLNARDKCRLALNQHMLGAESAGSLWQRSERWAAKLPVAANNETTHLILTEALLIESFLEPVMDKAQEFKLITLEEFVLVTAPVYQSIATFFGFRARHQLDQRDWQSRYKVIPDFMNVYNRLRADMTDLLENG